MRAVGVPFTPSSSLFTWPWTPFRNPIQSLAVVHRHGRNIRLSLYHSVIKFVLWIFEYFERNQNHKSYSNLIFSITIAIQFWFKIQMHPAAFELCKLVARNQDPHPQVTPIRRSLGKVTTGTPVAIPRKFESLKRSRVLAYIWVETELEWRIEAWPMNTIGKVFGLVDNSVLETCIIFLIQQVECSWAYSCHLLGFHSIFGITK
jgi:hypothetical protein